jgi:drug/metabolite transporter (DMT)-like permease
MTSPDTGVIPREEALGFAQRRSWIFSAWWYPAVLGVSGAVQAGLALALGQSPEPGIVLAVLGAAFAALGWALAARVRFTRRPPRPASDIPRAEQGIRLAPVMIRTILIAGAVVVGALVLFTPKGGSPDTLPLLGMLVVWPLGLAAGLAHTRRLMLDSTGLYARWLERR